MALKCLIVEDCAFMQEVYRYTLLDNDEIEIVGYALDGKMAVKLLRELTPDILLLDLVLPDKNGLDVLSEIPFYSPTTKVIIVSSLDDEEIISKAKALGAIEYIKKPFTKQQLLGAIAEVGKNYLEVNNG